MKKPYSLAERKWLKQIQYSLNVQAFNSSWIQKKKAAWVSKKIHLNLEIEEVGF